MRCWSRLAAAVPLWGQSRISPRFRTKPGRNGSALMLIGASFGRTGLNISTVSMGTNRLGDAGVDPAVRPPIVERALELGVNLSDTSISYNQGRSEAILGKLTSHWPRPTVIATKVGYTIDYVVSGALPMRDFTATAICTPLARGLLTGKFKAGEAIPA